MARQPRLIVPDVAVHIVQRGNNRMRCFHEESDYRVYLNRLRALTPKYGCLVHAYCLMPNHIHLLLTPRMPSACALVMKDLSQPYAHYFNRKYARTGTLWEGRYRSCIAESARYVIACYRYVELNPVRAGLAVHPGLYPWSSYAANTGKERDPLVAPHAEFLALANEANQRYLVYGALLAEGLDASTLGAIRTATRGGYAVGSGRPQSVRPESVPDPAPSVPDPELF